MAFIYLRANDFVKVGAKGRRFSLKFGNGKNR